MTIKNHSAIFSHPDVW